MNEQAIAAYAQRILKAGGSYAILRRGVQTMFMDGPIILDISRATCRTRPRRSTPGKTEAKPPSLTPITLRDIL